MAHWHSKSATTGAAGREDLYRNSCTHGYPVSEQYSAVTALSGLAQTAIAVSGPVSQYQLVIEDCYVLRFLMSFPYSYDFALKFQCHHANQKLFHSKILLQGTKLAQLQTSLVDQSL